MVSGVFLLALTLAGPQAQPPAAAPPDGSEPVVRTIEVRFPTQGNVPLVDPQTYLYYIQTKPSRPSASEWESYRPSIALDDFRRLWDTKFLDDIWIEVRDEPFPNGVEGKHLVYNLVERQRVRTIEYQGSRTLETSRIEEALRDAGQQIRPDSFLDTGIVHRAEAIVRGLLQEKGFQYSTVTHEIREMAAGQKLVSLVFTIDDGPKVRIRSLTFEGNTRVSSGKLRGVMKDNRTKPWWIPGFATSRGAYFETKFESDADRLVEHYRNHGYVTARVGAPRLEPIGDSSDGRTRWVDLRIPVEEGPRYRVGEFVFDGAAVLKSEALRTLFKVKPGHYYAESAVRKGIEKARDIYGTIGYFEFTGYPDLKPRDADGLVDVTMRLQEGKQYFVNVLSFSGNTVTRDNVIRRELALSEGGVFNTEALKYSVKRLNQLGYFKPIEAKDGIQVEKTPGVDNRVDVKVKVEEQNRNQLMFGGGFSQYDGFFGNFQYTVASFLGRGESVSMAVQRGTRSTMYQLAISEPYLFNRPISVGADLYSRKNDFFSSVKEVAYSEVREGASLTVGRPLWKFLRGFFGFNYEVTDIAISEDFDALTSMATTDNGDGVPSFNAATDEGRHTDSRLTPSLVYNSVDHPFMPHRGMRLSFNSPVGGTWLGGSYNYVKPEGEAIVYLPTTRRTGFGFRAQGGWLHMYGKTRELPYYYRYYLGGEYQIRGVNLRTVGPVNEYNRLLGGNKFVLFNAEYYLDLFGQVRLVAFHDAGQAFLETKRFDLRQLRTSTGAEIRVVMPMVNVPFRLIYARNFYRDTFQPAWVFKFAVGTTF
jgi:outer membrane protein insertion porin family